VEWYRQGKLLIRPPQLPSNHTNSHLGARLEELAREIINLALRSILVIVNMPQNLTTWGRRLYFPAERRRSANFYRPRKGLNPRPLGPMASTLIITPPRRTGCNVRYDTCGEDTTSPLQVCWMHLVGTRYRIWDNQKTVGLAEIHRTERHRILKNKLSFISSLPSDCGGMGQSDQHHPGYAWWVPHPLY
jgi:hypothetical protein